MNRKLFAMEGLPSLVVLHDPSRIHVGNCVGIGSDPPI